MDISSKKLLSELKEIEEKKKFKLEKYPWKKMEPENGVLTLYFNEKTNCMTDIPDRMYLILEVELKIASDAIKTAKENHLKRAVEAFEQCLTNCSEINRSSSFTTCRKICSKQNFWDIIPHQDRIEIFYKHVLNLPREPCQMMLQISSKLSVATDRAESLEAKLAAYKLDTIEINRLQNKIESMRKKIAIMSKPKEESPLIRELEIENKYLEEKIRNLFEEERQYLKIKEISKNLDSLQLQEPKTGPDCIPCNLKFRSKELLNNHLVRRHFAKMHCEIPDCSFSTVSKFDYIRHVEKKHTPRDEASKSLLLKLKKLSADYTKLEFVVRS